MLGFGQGNRFRLFRIAGFPVFAEPSLLILLILFLVLGASGGAAGTIWGLIFAVVAVGSIILHELGHAMAVRRLGYGESVIVLHGLGGLTQWRGEASRRDRILISLAGPGVNVVLGSIALVIVLITGLPDEFLARSAVQAWLFVNLGWAAFNLMPIWPLDGGHVTRYALATPGRPQRETLRLSLTISMVAAGLLIAAGLYYRQLFVAILLGFILFSNYQEYQRLKGPPPSFYGY